MMETSSTHFFCHCHCHWGTVTLVLVFLCLVLTETAENNDSRSLPIFTLHFGKRHLRVVNDNVRLVPKVPTIYGFFKWQNVPCGPSDDPNWKPEYYYFFLRAEASGRYVCMKKNGVIFTKDMKMLKKKLKKGKRFNQQQEKESKLRKRLQVGKKNCLFRPIFFPKDHPHSRLALLSVSHSNESVGLFMGYNEEGGGDQLVAVYKNFDDLSNTHSPFENEAVKLTVKNVSDGLPHHFLNITGFSKGKPKLNKAVRRCIRRKYPIFKVGKKNKGKQEVGQGSTVRSLNKKKKNNLRKIIQVCLRKAKAKAKVQNQTKSNKQRKLKLQKEESNEIIDGNVRMMSGVNKTY